MRWIVLGAALACAMLTGPAIAQSGGGAQVCASDARRLCPGIPLGGGGRLACLRERIGQVSSGCRDFIERLGGGLTPPDSGEPPGQGTAPAAAIPRSYAALYSGLERALDAAERRLPKPRPGARAPIYATELLAANSNRGPALLERSTMDVVRTSLDRFKDLGVGAVKVAVHYPILRPDYPRAAEYLPFYRQVFDMARERGLRTLAHVTVVFANTAFSEVKGDIYRGLDLQTFIRTYAEQVKLITEALRPDYIAMMSEPDTQARLTGLKELEDPAVVARVINAALTISPRSATRFAAGSGSWSGTRYAETLARDTSLDLIAIHIYPITGPMLDHADEMSRIARAAGKGVMIDEAWLYKVLRPGGGEDVAATAQIFRRDLFSFWQNLDMRFMDVVDNLARTHDAEFLSFFWSGLFFAYLEHEPRLDRLSYGELTREHNREVFQAMRQGRLSRVGEHYRAMMRR